MTSNLFALVAQAAPAAGGASRNLMVMLIYLVSFGLIAYFILIRPQRKMQQTHQQMLGALKKGDEVLTEGGIIGSVVHIQDDRITIKSGEARLVVARLKISRVINPPAAGATAEKA